MKKLMLLKRDYILLFIPGVANRTNPNKNSIELNRTSIVRLVADWFGNRTQSNKNFAVSTISEQNRTSTNRTDWIVRFCSVNIYGRQITYIRHKERELTVNNAFNHFISLYEIDSFIFWQYLNSKMNINDVTGINMINF